MLPLLAARTFEEGLPLETRISGFEDSAVPISCGAEADTFCFSTP